MRNTKKKNKKLSSAVIAGTATLLIIFCVTADLIGYKSFTKTITAQYQDNALSIADEAADIINTDELEEFVSLKGKSQNFKETHDELQKLCNNMNAEFIYVIYADNDNYSKIEFVIEVVNKNSKFEEYPVGKIKDTTNDEYKERYSELYENKTDRAIVVRDKGFIETGSHITALVPLSDSHGNTKAILAVQKQMEYLNKGRVKYINAIIITSAVLIAISGAGWYLFLKKRLINPITSISKEAQRFAADGTVSSSPLSGSVKYNDELGMLAVTVDEMEEKTVKNFTALNKMTKEKERVDSELNLARDIQANMLPDFLPDFPGCVEFDVHASMAPAREVGGDFYDFFLVDDSHLAIVIADVSGKGVPAALFMVKAKTLIKNTVQMGLEPADVFTKVNAALCENNKVGLFVTAWAGILDLETGRLVYANAGHNPPLIKRAGEGYKYLKNRSGLVLAGMEMTRYKQFEFTLNHGDRFFLYTDGVTEATDINNNLYGETRLCEFLTNNGDGNITTVLSELRKNIDEFTGEADQFDDMTMLLLDYK